jgi:hypothetical protein
MFTKILVAIALVLAIATTSIANDSLFFLTAMWGGGSVDTTSYVYFTADRVVFGTDPITI